MKSSPSKNEATQKNQKPPRRGIGLWLDNVRCKLTVHTWRRKSKKQHKRGRLAVFLDQNPYAMWVGTVLYSIGFWVEYMAVCTARTTKKVVLAVAQNVGALLVMILRPFFMGIATLLGDIARPFLRMGSGLRHIRELPETLQEETPREIRAEKVQYFKRGTKLYFPLVTNALSYILPVAAAVGLIWMVDNRLSYHYVLNVQVNGQSVGYVESEQVFESASEDVQSRINNAKAMMEAAGNEVADAQWEVEPTYTLAIADQTMTESEVANAILRTASDEIGEGTAVYIDGALRFVTTDGDHLRTYLESVKAPYKTDLDPDVHINFVHDIELVDGVYLLSSIMPYDTVLAELSGGGGTQAYTAQSGDTVQTVLDATGISFDSFVALNPDLQSTDQEIDEGREVVTGVSSPELLKVKVVRRQTIIEDIQYDQQESESDEYAFGKTVVVQEGALGQQEVTTDTTYVDGVVTDSSIVNINVVQNPVTEVTVKGTKLASGMTASVGSGSFVWPVPGYSYVSRWMSSYHKGADICAPYGTEIIASDSGVVTTAGTHYSYGNYVVIDHGNGYSTLYAHMSRIAVTVGQGVSQKQVIGYVGSTGDSTGNHCHFEMYSNGVRFSAQNLFSGMRTHL